METSRLIISSFFVSLICSLNANSLINLPYAGVEVKYTNLQGQTKTIVVEKNIPQECFDVDLSPEEIWSGNFANPQVHKNCKKEFITIKGIIQPIEFNDKIKTIGELEVLDFLKNKAQISPDKFALIDSRPREWYEQMTIPGAINVPYDELEMSEIVSYEQYKENLNKLGITIENGKLNISKAKTIILFCNGPWCSQSNQKITKLIKLGYPQEKIFWYRGGMHDWLSMSMTVVSPKQ